MKTNHWKLQSLKLAGLSAAVLLFAAACGETGSEGNLRFTDLTGAEDKMVLPVAEGRDARYKVMGAGAFSSSRDIESATSTDESVLEIVGFNGAELTVRGIKPGTAMVDVIATDGSRDRLQLEVRAEHNSYYLIKTLGSGSVAGLIDVKGKYNLHTGDTAGFHKPVFVDKDGIRLSGAGNVGLDEPEALGSMTATFGGDADLNVAAGAESDEVSIGNPYGSTLNFRTKDALEPASIVGVRYAFPIVKNIQSGTSFRMAEGIYTMRFLPVDADGYRYVGSHDLQASATLSDANNINVTYVNWSNLEEDFCKEESAAGDCVAWENLPAAAFNVAPRTTGEAASGTLKISVGSVSQDFTIEIPAN